MESKIVLGGRVINMGVCHGDGNLIHQCPQGIFDIGYI